MKTITKETFLQEYQAWQNETLFNSTSQSFDNEHYRNIVAMGKGAVSYIHDIIKKEPNPIVYALGEILKDEVKVKVDGFMDLDTYCKMWDMILDSLLEKA